MRSLHALAICMLVIITYGSTLGIGFISDDFYLINRVHHEGFYHSWGGTIAQRSSAPSWFCHFSLIARSGGIIQ